MASPETDTARHLRRNMTVGERRLWDRLRGKQLGVKFRRQHPLGPFVADFASVEARLVVEIDSDIHVTEYDRRRDAWMQACGWRVMRIPVGEIDEDLDATVDTIAHELVHPGSMLTYGQRDPSPPT